MSESQSSEKKPVRPVRPAKKLPAGPKSKGPASDQKQDAAAEAAWRNEGNPN